MYRTIKAIKPDADVSWHVDHKPSGWGMVYRAEMSYAEMAPHSDFIKFIAYHDMLGPRIRYWYLDRFKKRILGELSLEESLDLYHELFGYDKNVEPRLNELATKGFSPDYVFRETKRSVASAENKTKIYTGVGFDVPWGNRHVDADLEEVYQCVLKAFEAAPRDCCLARIRGDAGSQPEGSWARDAGTESCGRIGGKTARLRSRFGSPREINKALLSRVRGIVRKDYGPNEPVAVVFNRSGKRMRGSTTIQIKEFPVWSRRCSCVLRLEQ